jgi:hypothetical protein
MSVFECGHALQVAKSTLKALVVDTRLILEAMDSQLNFNTIINGLMHDWRGLFDSMWFDFRNLVIISYHDLAGTGINNTTVASNPALLLPVQNGASFVRVTCTVDFTGLVAIPTYGPTMLRICFYLELPKTTVAMLNGSYVAYNLMTWHARLTSPHSPVRTFAL